MNKCISTQRGIASLLIILIHCRFPGLLGGISVAVARAAVFYFFIISGFFTFRADERAFYRALKRQTLKIVKITGIAFILGITWRIILAVFGKSGSLAMLVREWINPDSLINILVFQKDIILGPYWFLISLLLCYPAIYFIRKTKAFVLSEWLMILLLLMNVFLSEIINIENIIYYRNFWLSAFPFFLIGYLFHKRIEKITTRERKTAVWGMYIGVALTVVEYFILGNRLIYVGSVVLALSALLYAVDFPDKEIKFLSTIGEKYSLIIYIIHWYFIDIYAIVLRYLNLQENYFIQCMMPLIIIISSVTFGIIWTKIIRAIDVKLIKSEK